MSAGDEITHILSIPPPRPLKHVTGGPAFIKSVAYLFVAVVSIIVGLVDLWYYLFAHYREPIFGNEILMLSYIVFILSIGGFVFFWSMSFMNIYSIYLFRKGNLILARVEKAYLQEKSGRPALIVNWAVEEDGKISKGAISSTVPDISVFRQDVAGGDTMFLLSSGKDLGDAMPVGMMGLKKDWLLFPSLAVPSRFSAARGISIAWALVCAAIAAMGFTSSHFINEKVPMKFVIISAGASLLAALVFWLLSRRTTAWFRPSWYMWTAGIFVFSYCMVMGGIKGLNVWLDKSKPHIYKEQVLHLDDSVFPQLQRFVYVRSWREGRVTEKIPISMRTGQFISSGDMVTVEVQDGYFDMPAITGLR